MRIVLLDHRPSRTAIRRRTGSDRLSGRAEFIDHLRGHSTFERFRFVERNFQFGTDPGFAPVRNRLAGPREQVPIPRHRNWNQHDLAHVIGMRSIEFLVKARRRDIEVRNTNVGVGAGPNSVEHPSRGRLVEAADGRPQYDDHPIRTTVDTHADGAVVQSIPLDGASPNSSIFARSSSAP
ncbi:hypothetical protein [Rhodococcus erythropolis]|uniref:hypothetical protein n=1 Tax=Rhodococcus erythropolis TaxID=1833 RepID=UPI001CD9AB2F|nr:hypothetical protein [Rhodococcus erythropolis]